MDRSFLSIRWLVVATVAAVILVVSVLPPPSDVGSQLGPFGLVGIDKWFHGLGYSLLAGVLAIALADNPRSDRTIAVLTFGITVAYGLGIELLQLAIPRRQFDLFDLLANSLGAAAVGIGWRIIPRRWRGRTGIDDREGDGTTTDRPPR
ncbi:MAG: VanZ family protein [Halobacteriales archaeon]|nr:VanZ family protein [Halobacteriales archaeon]